MRYLPLTTADREEMLKEIGVSSVDDLFKDIPEQARLKELVDLPTHMGEMEVDHRLSAMAARNTPASEVPSFLGAGAYRHHVPASVDHLIQRGEFLTAYTPYQPEVSQGTLQYLYEFQTQVSMITGMDVSNASMYDGSTGCVEAVMMANRISRRNKALLSGGLHPMYKEIVTTHGKSHGFESECAAVDFAGEEDLISQVSKELSCVVVQNPSTFGHLRDLRELAKVCQANKVLLIVVVTEVVSLGLVMSPGEMGADIVVAEGQSIGNPVNFGGPYVGLFATRKKYMRQMPGRLTGQSVDAEGKRGWVLTLSTREQHIRREKATSNICTNAGLCALAFSIHLSLLGEVGFKKLAKINHGRAVRLAKELNALDGVEVLNKTFFNEFTVKLSKPAATVVSTLADMDILAGVSASRLYPNEADAANLLLVAVTELNSDEDMNALISGLKEVLV